MEGYLCKCARKCDRYKSIALLMLRLFLARGFYEPFLSKWENKEATVTFFRDGLQLPFPELNYYLVTSVEALAVMLLPLGLFTRLISLPLMVTMLVAIVTVHWDGGFSGSNGFKIPLAYLIMLFTLLTHGAGKYSLDKIFTAKKHQE